MSETNKKTDHTPGPWKVSRRFDVYEDSQTSIGGTYIGTTRGNRELPESVNLRCEADATLIADAPSMLEALRELLECSVTRESMGERSVEAFRAARVLVEKHYGSTA